jgi:hypothetical protein
MRAERRWIVWRYSDDGKKLPRDPKNPGGKPVDATDESLWVDYDTAVAAAASVKGAALGFVLGDGWTGIDLDDCRDPQTGVISPEAQKIITDLNTYTEISPSEEGVKAFCKAWLGKPHARKGLEVYSTGRYFAVTGQHLEGTPTEIEGRASEVEALIAREFDFDTADEVRDDELPPVTDVPDSFEDDTEIIDTNRNIALTRIGGSLRRIGLDDDELLAALIAIDQNRCKPPMGKQEVSVIARSLGKYPPSKAERAVAWMNERHAVLNESGKAIVITERIDKTLGEPRFVIDRSTAGDIHLLYRNRKYEFKVKGEKKKVFKALGEIWLDHPGRRQYSQLIFDPEVQHPADVYNLWRGFAVTPTQGSWSALRDHIFDVIANRDDAVFRYLEGWLARAVQKPGRPGEVAIVLRGPQGAGKGIVARAIGHLFGQHFLHISQAKHLTGHFNAHLQDAVLVFGDEAVWGGDRQNEGALKTLVTEPTIAIERKGKDVTRVRNVIHLIVASNNDWTWPADLDDRRGCVLDVPASRVGDHTYFGTIQDQLEHGGYEAMLYDLQHYDLSTFNHRQPPKTAALLDQKIRHFSPVQRWWFDKLTSGYVLAAHDDWQTEIPRPWVLDNCIDTLKDLGVAQRPNDVELGLALVKLLPRGWPKSGRSVYTVDGEKRRLRTYLFPSLLECRKAFADHVKQRIVWPDAPDGEQGDLLDKEAA